MGSRSDTSDSGRPWSLTISFIKCSVIRAAALLFLHGKKCAILEKRSTTTQIASFLACERGNPVMKSNERSSHGRAGMGSGIYNLFDGEPDLVRWHTGQCLTNLLTSLRNPDQKKTFFQ